MKNGEIMMKKHSKKHADKKNNDKKQRVVRKKENIFNVPNSLTMLRLILAPVFMILLLTNKYIAAFVVIVVASITDFLDGQIARRFNMQTEFGRILDPIADKVLVFCSVIALLITFHFPLWVGLIIISRDIIILLGGLIFLRKNQRKALAPNIFGKISTLFQLTTFAIFILASIEGYYALWIDILIYLTVALTLLSGIIYIFKGYTVLYGRKD